MHAPEGHTLRGHIEGQRVVLDDPLPAGLPERTPVRVIVSPANGASAGGGNCLSSLAEMAQDGGLPADFAEQHEHYTKGKPRV